MLVLLIAAIVGCGANSPDGKQPTQKDSDDTGTRPTEVIRPTNVLVILADDLGRDKVGAYGVHPEAPSTPNIDGLAAEGLMFRRAYSYPSCSPTRSAALTGRLGRRTGVGRHLKLHGESWFLQRDEVTIPEMLEQSNTRWDHSMVGKWHLTTVADLDVQTHPLDQGFNWAAGAMSSLKSTDFLTQPGGAVGYSRWEKNDNGTLVQSTKYATTDTVDDAILRMAQMESPWFLWLAFNAPHSPYHVPPSHLAPAGAPGGDSRAKYDAMVEAMDTELGRLFGSMSSELRNDTLVVFLGDNGTPKDVLADDIPETQSKGEITEGGVNIPFIVSGPLVQEPGTETDALVHVADIFATVADIAEVPFAAPIDGISFLPVLEGHEDQHARTYVIAEKFRENGGPPYQTDEQMIANDRYKLSRYVTSQGVAVNTEHFYDLSDFGWYEGQDLLETTLEPDAQAAYTELAAQLDEAMGAMIFDHAEP